ncbi:MAG TPA: response regulator [Candidatus Limnocylindria bacterium]|nr:response regulator [Candidatus Limnocylindria bacterium]
MKKTILLADDDASIRTMVGRVLESENYNVVFAFSGRDAALRFMAGPPDLVLLDLNMPDKDGWEAWRLMNYWKRRVPVIVITARPHQYAQARESKVDALMEKPLDLHLLLETIQRLLAESNAAHAARLSDPYFKTALLSAPALADAKINS